MNYKKSLDIIRSNLLDNETPYGIQNEIDRVYLLSSCNDGDEEEPEYVSSSMVDRMNKAKQAIPGSTYGPTEKVDSNDNDDQRCCDHIGAGLSQISTTTTVVGKKKSNIDKYAESDEKKEIRTNKDHLDEESKYTSPSLEEVASTQSSGGSPGGAIAGSQDDLHIDNNAPTASKKTPPYQAHHRSRTLNHVDDSAAYEQPATSVYHIVHEQQQTKLPPPRVIRKKFGEDFSSVRKANKILGTDPIEKAETRSKLLGVLGDEDDALKREEQKTQEELSRRRNRPFHFLLNRSQTTRESPFQRIKLSLGRNSRNSEAQAAPSLVTTAQHTRIPSRVSLSDVEYEGIANLLLLIIQFQKKKKKKKKIYIFIYICDWILRRQTLSWKSTDTIITSIDQRRKRNG
ncbi:hypothetical protein RFI_27979 [Reticulomyxa filosa]|uniref:Uncharacterized protein n=1 Tax=Reticulomyxa filosa TaxID=46433 RepID=X6M7I4_RETFI|nr:hypothetical protein RFI_27979 [Reticulomyxa filosa]|eukprot:ETO09397.1 hypothetical protein RFI_27979 [Reticulomyxa filosa]